MRVIGLDVHRTFAEVVFLQDGVLRSGGRVELTAERLAAFGRGLSATDEVVLEATGNTAAIVLSLSVTGHAKIPTGGHPKFPIPPRNRRAARCWRR